jgi:hypothetical protein
MPLNSAELREAHVAFGTVEELVRRRRATYAAALELATGMSEPGEPSADLFDSPAVRAHLGEVISGTAGYTPDAMVAILQLVGHAVPITAGSGGPHLVGATQARTALAGALGRIEHELGRRGSEPNPIRLVLPGDPAFERAARIVADGLEMAVDVCPALALDLLPHVAMFAVVDAGSSGDLGSASVREYPGLIVLPEPRSALEVAEALMHEGAHQKFFDIAITHSIFGGPAGADDPPSFAASWAGPLTARWPFEQCVAAYHAYSCLAAFMHAMRDACVSTSSLHEFSLLPHADDRARELGEWLIANRDCLGPDGRRFLATMTGVEPTGEDHNRPAHLTLQGDVPTVIRDCGEWTLVAQRRSAIDLYWAPSGGLARAGAR